MYSRVNNRIEISVRKTPCSIATVAVEEIFCKSCNTVHTQCFKYSCGTCSAFIRTQINQQFVSPETRKLCTGIKCLLILLCNYLFTNMRVFDKYNYNLSVSFFKEIACDNRKPLSVLCCKQ